MKLIIIALLLVIVGETGYILHQRSLILAEQNRTIQATLGSVHESLRSAIYVREGLQEKLLKELEEDALPWGARVLPNLEASRSGAKYEGEAKYILWRIKRYFLDYNIPLPDEVSRVSDQKPNSKRKLGSKY